MTLYIRVSKISGVPIEQPPIIKAVYVSLLGQDRTEDFSYCRITPDPNHNNYHSIIESDKIWKLPINLKSPCSIVVSLLNMEPEEIEIERAILSSSWFNTNTYVSEFFPLKPMVPCLSPAVALIDIHLVVDIPANKIFTPFTCPKGEMAIAPRWRSLKPFIPNNQQRQPDFNNSNNNVNNNNQNTNQIPSFEDNNLQFLTPDENESNEEQSKFTLSNLIKRKRSNSAAKNDRDNIEFPNIDKLMTKKIDPYYLAFEKYAFDEKTLQDKYEEFENGIKHANNNNIERRGSQNQVNNIQRRSSQNQVNSTEHRKEPQNQQNRPIPAIHTKKPNESYKLFE